MLYLFQDEDVKVWTAIDLGANITHIEHFLYQVTILIHFRYAQHDPELPHGHAELTITLFLVPVLGLQRDISHEFHNISLTFAFV